MKNLKKFVALVLAGTMVIGSTTMVFAEDPAPASADGTGTYEGNKMEYPTLSLTLPTITAGTYNYVADPNGNLAAVKDNSLGNDAKLQSNTGIYFKTDSESKTYTETSADYKVLNANAQDIVVTASVKVKTAGAASVLYSEDSNFSADTVKDKTAIYLAIQNKAKTKIAALKDATNPAEVQLVIKGKKDNYEPKYNSEATGNKYSYALKSGVSATDADKWNAGTFNLTGALNKNVVWNSTSSAAITFPTVTVTYKYEAVPVMTGAAATGYEYTWATAPTGTLQAIAIDGVDRPGVLSGGKVTYTTGKLAIDPAPVANFGLATGNHTIVVKIGANADSATEYTLNIEN